MLDPRPPPSPKLYSSTGGRISSALTLTLSIHIFFCATHRGTIVCGYRGPTGLVPQLEGSPKGMEQVATQTGQSTLSALVRAPMEDPEVPRPLFCIPHFHAHTPKWEETIARPDVAVHVCDPSSWEACIEGLLQVPV